MSLQKLQSVVCASDHLDIFKDLRANDRHDTFFFITIYDYAISVQALIPSLPGSSKIGRTYFPSIIVTPGIITVGSFRPALCLSLDSLFSYSPRDLVYHIGISFFEV